MIGVIMILIQVILGGITRLTESGLSITDWDVVMGTFPPMSKEAWLEAFEEYKQIPQYEVLNAGMSLKEFKWIYFWEYFHRLWARILGLVFFFPLLYFAIRKFIPPRELPKYLFILLLGGLQGFIGWIMVKSGLEDRVFVDPLKLMLHLLAAAALLILVYRLALENLRPPTIRFYSKRIRILFTVLIVLTIIQLGFGGLVAGARAALSYPTWPKMGAVWIPSNILGLEPVWRNFLENNATLQLMHRSLAYIILIFTILLGLRTAGVKASALFHQSRILMMAVVVLQVLLGIVTLLNSKIHIPVSWGVLHQLIGLIFLMVLVRAHYAYKYA